MLSLHLFKLRPDTAASREMKCMEKREQMGMEKGEEGSEQETRDTMTQ